ncbi:MAG: GMC family oxidoreductase [Candidatus Melainabacteria bacterium]|nr:MAG: GMC family oxidoreductase [Candidatus Melainabacteria bacterium]
MNTQYDFDVVIVGAGVAGLIMAKQILEDAGNFRVLVLEAGGERSKSFEGHREYLKNFFEALIKIPNSPYPAEFYAPHPNELETKLLNKNDPAAELQYVLQNGPQPFRTTYTRSLGGTVQHWLGTCLRLRPSDLKMRTTYGRGLDWPLTYEELMPYYRKAEFEIGVAGDVDEQKLDGFKFEDGYVYPMEGIPKSYVDSELERRLNGHTFTYAGTTQKPRVTASPQGRNGIPNPKYKDENKNQYVPLGAVGRGDLGLRCEGNSSCVPICPAQAKYTPVKTLNKIDIPEYADRFSILYNSVATKLHIEKESGNIESLEYKKYGRGSISTKQVTAKVYILAAHAVENAKLLLNSSCKNDLIGRNLMDHPFVLTWGLSDWNAGTFRGPAVTSTITSLCDLPTRKDLSACRIEISNWGWNWATGSPYAEVDEFLGQGLHGQKLREALKNNISRQIEFNFLTEQLPDKDNRVTIDENFRDELELPRPKLHYQLGEYERAGLIEAKKVSDQIFKSAGVTDCTKYDKKDPGYFEFGQSNAVFYGAGHIGGTHIMGLNANDSVVDKDQRSHDHRNLFAIGSGSFPTMGTSNPTLTIAALSFRSAEAVLRQLKQANPWN